MIKKINWVRALILALLIVAVCLVIFRKQIAENDLTKQKLEILKALQEQDMEKAGELSKTFVDSLSEKLK